MRIVFLDIDGVLNHACTKERFQGYIGVDEKNLEYFAKFLEIANMEEETKVVLSSSWREDVNREGESVSDGYQYICERLASVGIAIYDITPFFERLWEFPNRGEEITAWLSEHKDLDITGYVVLDDEHGMEFKEYGLSKRWVRTSWDSARGGFQPKHVKKALDMLQLPFLMPEKQK